MNRQIATERIIEANRARKNGQAAVVMIVCLCAALLVSVSGLVV